MIAASSMAMTAAPTPMPAPAPMLSPGEAVHEGLDVEEEIPMLGVVLDIEDEFGEDAVAEGDNEAVAVSLEDIPDETVTNGNC
jgi:hypothetical protein